MEVLTLYIWKQINIVRKESSSIHMSLNVQKWEVFYTLLPLNSKSNKKQGCMADAKYVQSELLTKLSSPDIRELCHDFAAIKDNLAMGST